MDVSALLHLSLLFLRRHELMVELDPGGVRRIGDSHLGQLLPEALAVPGSVFFLFLGWAFVLGAPSCSCGGGIGRGGVFSDSFFLPGYWLET